MAATNEPEVVTTVKASTHIELPLHPKKPTYDQLNPKSAPTEFLGPLGCLAVTILCPLFCYILYFGCNERTGCPPSFDVGRYDLLVLTEKLFDGKAFLVYLGWYAYTVVCWRFIPGDWVEGKIMRNGKKQAYKINGRSPKSYDV
jgi:delta14-sterol reductase